ncbi:hypothetical protein LPTSP2_38670 [Leptospira ellinghausenii]|uniref:Uncharacterized protein n=1 Tax=Leptospira ellinghausenii TaxID=1917822 RepID=A0A2P2DIY0_9LEPT|nr:hypothetical protein [Leptospira ellinghausenii]GBF44564.1 hypothetical protein LPTSP2_38670 [Leptospira ellinghausenii]
MKIRPEIERRCKILTLLVIRMKKELSKDVWATYFSKVKQVGSMIDENNLIKAEEEMYKLELQIIGYIEMQFDYSRVS